MGSTLYLDCSSGISGDMTVAALLDLGADRAVLDAALASLPDRSFTVNISRVNKSGLDACDFDVRLDAEHETHDHDMVYLFGHEQGVVSEVVLGEQGVAPEDPAGVAADAAGAEHARHAHRSLADVTAIIEAADLTPRAREVALRVFSILAEAEAQAHGTTLEAVRFHEVGAIDSIVDIVAAAVCYDSLDVDNVIVTEMAEGTGTVRGSHGIMPIPVPAVCAIAERYRLPLHTTAVRGELVTPTGAALVAALRTGDTLPERYLITGIGIGAGKRTYEGCSGIVRALRIEALD